MAMSEMVIETDGLTRYFGSRCVVSSLSLKVPRGSVFGFLGRNGAGKSTTIRMLMGLVRPTRGSATLLGVDCTQLTPEARGRIGYLAEGHHAYGWMTVAEAEQFQRGSYKWWNAKLFQTVIEHFRLTPGMKAKELSRGQRAGLCLAMTLAPEPELLILDDPALGLDPVARHSLLEAMIYVTRQAGQTILFSSHLLSDVERVADRIAVIDGGVLRAECPVDTFRERIRSLSLTFAGSPPAELPPIPGLLRSRRDGRELSVTIANFNERSEAILAGLGADRIEPRGLSLEEAFIEYVSRQETQSLLVSATQAGQSEAQRS
jgi:ABC-2 type transport system ATP-binding protein